MNNERGYRAHLREFAVPKFIFDSAKLCRAYSRGEVRAFI